MFKDAKPWVALQAECSACDAGCCGQCSPHLLLGAVSAVPHCCLLEVPTAFWWLPGSASPHLLLGAKSAMPHCCPLKLPTAFWRLPGSASRTCHLLVHLKAGLCICVGCHHHLRLDIADVRADALQQQDNPPQEPECAGRDRHSVRWTARALEAQDAYLMQY